MSFSSDKAKYENLGPAAGLTSLERDHIVAPTPTINPDHAVELLVDEIRTQLCQFRFKQPLGQDFETARDHAINCLETNEIMARKIHHWISDCIKCMDVILLVYMRDVLNTPIPKTKQHAKERDVYDCYEQHQDGDLVTVGGRMNAVYQKRSDPFEHSQVVTKNGRREIKRTTNKQKIEAYGLVRDFVRDSLDIMVPRYRAAFPAHCTVAP
jgi:hypothetical protein